MPISIKKDINNRVRSNLTSLLTGNYFFPKRGIRLEPTWVSDSTDFLGFTAFVGLFFPKKKGLRMPMNSDGKIGRKCRVNKRGRSSPSSSSFHRSYRLKRVFLVGKRVGSSTPVPRWKMSSLGLENGEAGRELVSVSARKLGATLWEIDDYDRVGKQRSLECWKLKSMAESDLSSPVSEMMNLGSHRRGASAGSQKTMQADSDLGGAKSIHGYSEVDRAHNLARSPYTAKNRLKEVYNGLITSKELLKVTTRVSNLGQQSPTGVNLFSALKSELDRACAHVTKLIQEQKANQSDINSFLKHFEEEKMLRKLREQDRIRSSIASIASELDTERKLRRQTERLNKKLGRELSETKESLLKANKDLESERRAREILEQVCDELSQGIGDDKAEVEELKRQSAKVCEEVEKEREMLQLADLLREERVQMKLSEAKYQFEEKNSAIDSLRDELEAYLKSKKVEERGIGSPSHEKIKELEKYLRETLPCSYEYKGEEKNYNKKNIGMVNDDDEDDDDSDNSDLHSIELNVDDISKSFRWNSVEKITKIKKPTFSLEARHGESEQEFDNSIKGENLDVFEKRGLFEFASKPNRKMDVEDEMERYNMIKDLRDNIVSGSKMTSSQGSDCEQKVSSKDDNGVV